MKARWRPTRSIWLAALSCAALALAPLSALAQGSAPKPSLDTGKKAFGGCFNPLIEPQGPVVSADVGSTARFAATDNLGNPYCMCGGDVRVQVTTSGLTPSQGVRSRISDHPAAPTLSRIIDVDILPYGPQDIPFSICISASRPAGGTCGSWNSETYCERRTLHVNQERVRGDLSTSASDVTIRPGEQGSVTVSWWTTSAKSAALYVQSGGKRTLLSSELNGQYTHAQLEPYKTYTFELYANDYPLGQRSVKTSAAIIPSATLSATPSTVVVPAGATGTTSLQWSTQNVRQASLRVSVDGRTPTVVAGGLSGRVNAPWIQAGHTYVFTVKDEYWTADPTPLASVTVRGVLPAATPPATGHWFNPARSGNGWDIQQVSSDTVSLIWFTYTGSGTPTWYLSNLRADGSEWTGELLEFSWSGSAASARSVGSAKLLEGNGQWRYQWTLGAASGEEPIQPLEFGGGAAAMDLSGNWYNAQSSGWGVLFETRGTAQLVMLPIYAGGRPTWLLGYAETQATSFDIPLTYTTGTNLCPGCTGSPSTRSQAAGTLSLRGSAGYPTTLSASLRASFPLGTWDQPSFTLSRLTGP